MTLVPPAEDIPPFAETGGDPFQQLILGKTGNWVGHLTVTIVRMVCIIDILT
jgi:hypothetical protein